MIIRILTLILACTLAYALGYSVPIAFSEHAAQHIGGR